MANPEENPLRGMITSWPAVAAVAVAVLGLVAVRRNLETPRPTSDGGTLQRHVGVPDVPARLWQDPLANVLQGPCQDDSKRFAFGMPDASSESQTGKILVLLNWIDADQNSDAAETRRRQRYSTLSALNTAGYVPVQANRLSYVDVNFQFQAKKNVEFRYSQTASANSNLKTKIGPGMVNRNVRLPFEWARPLRHAEKLPGDDHHPIYRGVCVVWVYEDIVLSNSLQALGELKDQLTKVINTNADAGAKCEFAIIGGVNSEQLGTFLKDDRRLEDAPILKGVLNGVKLIVSNSTAQELRDFTNRPKNSGITIEYVIGSDDLLMNALAKELANRRITRGDATIAIISEWDTLYGRNMPVEFRKAFLGREYDNQPKVHFYSYLRGLDGKLPVKADAPTSEDQGDAKHAKKSDPQADKPGATEAEGDAQIDYLRRLVERMQADHEHFQAIGILGSDVYDKLLLLQALRSSFPEALFFTTDLDARMLQPRESTWTRNLVVASHFGLSLDDKIQRKIPPFRSSYDTANYLGCLRAVGCPLLDRAATIDSDTTDKINGNTLIPNSEKEVTSFPVHLYEIGRNGAFELSIYDRAVDTIGARNTQRAVWITEGWRPLGLVACAALLGLLIYPVSRMWQRMLHDAGVACRFQEAPTLRFGIIGAGCAIALILLGLIIYAHGQEQEEPFSILEGISVWPTVSLRLLAAVLCAFFVATGLRDLEKRNEKVRGSFFFTRPASAAAPLPSGGFSRLWRTCWDTWHWSPDAEKIEDAWIEFEEHGRQSNRVYRCFALFVGAMMLYMLLWVLFDHTMYQARGPIAGWAAPLTLWLVVGTLVGLLIFVIDSTVLCYRFVQYLARHNDGWSPECLKKYADARGVDLHGGHAAIRKALDQLLMIRFIASVTDTVAHLIYYPFVVLFVVIASQSRLFDGWTWNFPLILILLLCAAGAMICAVIFQQSAHEARTKALDEMEKIALPLAQTGDAELRAKLIQIRTEIEEMDTGMFASFAKIPVVRAAMLSLGSGGLAAIEAFLM